MHACMQMAVCTSGLQLVLNTASMEGTTDLEARQFRIAIGSNIQVPLHYHLRVLHAALQLLRSLPPKESDSPGWRQEWQWAQIIAIDGSAERIPTLQCALHDLAASELTPRMQMRTAVPWTCHYMTLRSTSNGDLPHRMCTLRYTCS